MISEMLGYVNMEYWSVFYDCNSELLDMASVLPIVAHFKIIRTIKQEKEFISEEIMSVTSIPENV